MERARPKKRRDLILPVTLAVVVVGSVAAVASCGGGGDDAPTADACVPDDAGATCEPDAGPIV